MSVPDRPGESVKNTIPNVTSFWHDDRNEVGVSLRWDDGNYRVKMFPKAEARGVPQMPTKERSYKPEELLDLVEKARAEGKRNVTFICTYPTAKKQTQEGEMPIREVLHRIRNSKLAAEIWDRLYKRVQDAE